MESIFVRRHLVGLLLLLLISMAPVHAAETMAQTLDRIVDEPDLRGGIVGAEVARVSDGQILYVHNSDTRLMPASNRKLFTAAAALELLGGDFQLKTDVLAAQKPDAGGVLHSDLFLRGGGDGLLSVADMDDLARQVARAGVKRVGGGIGGDGTLFRDGPYPEGWEWDDLSDDYAPQISALEVNEGIVTVHVAAGQKPGDLATVTVEPPVDYLPVANSVRMVAAGIVADVHISRPYDSNYLLVGGVLPLGGTAQNTATVGDPARFAATVFRRALIRNGVAVDGPAFSGAAPVGQTLLLGSHLSLPMSEYLAKMDKPSDNLLAESLIRVLGAVKGSGGSYASGAAVAEPFFHRLGVDTTPLTLADGSGVSRRNFVTARAMTQLLAAMHGNPDWQAFYDSLPVAGVDGTLRRRMIGTAAAHNVHAKTGTLTGASCLSGYVTGKDGALYAFSLLFNNFPGAGTAARRAQDDFAEYLAAHL